MRTFDRVGLSRFGAVPTQRNSLILLPCSACAVCDAFPAEVAWETQNATSTALSGVPLPLLSKKTQETQEEQTSENNGLRRAACGPLVPLCRNDPTSPPQRRRHQVVRPACRHVGDEQQDAGADQAERQEEGPVVVRHGGAPHVVVGVFARAVPRLRKCLRCHGRLRRGAIVSSSTAHDAPAMAAMVAQRTNGWSRDRLRTPATNWPTTMFPVETTLFSIDPSRALLGCHSARGMPAAPGAPPWGTIAQAARSARRSRASRTPAENHRVLPQGAHPEGNARLRCVCRSQILKSKAASAPPGLIHC